jgi:two-component system, OmpR family, KDP operon response regulator KdpE
MPDLPTILVIEDESAIRRFLRAALSAHGYHVLEATSGHEGLLMAATHRPGLIILDLGLPDLDGLAVTMQLRSWTEVPIMILSAQGQEQAKVTALDAGADDYLTKPFGVDELLARMRVALRHFDRARAPAADPIVEVGDLRIDMALRRVTLGGQEIHLTPIQYGLLSALARHPGKVVTHTQLLREVWGPNYHDETHYLRVYMGQLRQKLEEQPAKPRYLLTEPGVGYRLAAG